MGLPYGMRHPDHRVDQPCHVCGVFDKAPRHHHQHIVDGTFVDQVRHIDCCAAAGCPDGSCVSILTAAGPKKDMELVAHIHSMGPNPHITGKE